MDIFDRFRELRQVMPSELIVVNLGAHDGACKDGAVVKDVANCAFDLGARGVAVEGLTLASTLEGRWKDVLVHVGYVSPANVTEIVGTALSRLAAKHVDLLKIDFDHADCFFAEALLRHGLAPAFMVVEYNRIFPPPIRFKERFSEAKAGRMGQSWMDGKRSQHWSGCSMQAWHDTAAAHGYELLQATLFDLTFLHQNVKHLDLGLDSLNGWPSSIFNTWLASAYCFAPSRRLYGHQAFASLDLRALPELPADDRCALAARWWSSEGQTSQSDPEQKSV